MYVIKRDGKKEKFNKEKIINAICAAVQEVRQDIPDENDIFDATEIANSIEWSCFNQGVNEIDIEDIQDMVETFLMRIDRPKIAKAYILYRDKRTQTRNWNSSYMKTYAEKLEAKNVQNQNANVDEQSFGGRTGEASDVSTKQYALDFIMSDLAKKRHLDNEIYTHDLSAYAVGMHNCLSIPFDKLLANGFDTRQTDVRTANSVNTAMQLVAVIFQLQSLQQFGGVSATHLDWTMVPYVRKSFRKHWNDGLKYIAFWDAGDVEFEDYDLPIDEYISEDDYKDIYRYALDMTEKEIKQAAEGLLHNLNTLQSRSGNQLPFTSINYGTCTLPEGRMITKAILETTIEGIGSKHRTSIFPCQIFQLGNGINRKPGDPNYDLFQLALKSTAQRLYPNYANIDWSGNAGYDKNDPTTYFSTMGK